MHFTWLAVTSLAVCVFITAALFVCLDMFLTQQVCDDDRGPGSAKTRTTSAAPVVFQCVI